MGVLAHLALAKNGIETRERLAGLLWSDRSEAQARASLRQCVKQLRDTFEGIGFSGLTTSRRDIHLDGAAVSVDLFAMRARLDDGTIPLPLVEGSARPERILYGFEDLDPAFASWLQVVRQRWGNDLSAQLEQLMRGAPNPSDARDAATALTQIDPTHEEAHRYLIRHHADMGKISAALEQYNTLWDLLGEQYDMEPADETANLIAAIKSGTYFEAGETNAGASGDTADPAAALAPDLAVAPLDPDAGPPGDNLAPFMRLPVIGIANFVQGGPWGQELYLIDGFRRDLISSLVRFREWVVVETDPLATKAVLTDAGGERGGNETTVAYELEGAYFEDDDELHLVITLKDAATQHYIWSENIDLSLDSWFAARRHVLWRVCVSLSVYLSVGRISRIAEHPSVSLDIYDRWLRGQTRIYNWQPDSHEAAVRSFQEIIAEAPGFSPSYSSLVQLLNSVHIVCPGTYRNAERHRRSLELARRAVALDPLDSRAQLCLGWAYAMNDRFDQSVLHHGMACDLNGHDIWTLVSAALGLAYADALPEAELLANQALQFAPNLTALQWAYLAGVKYQLGDLDGCVDAADRAGEHVHYLLAWKAAALAHMGDAAGARAAYQRFMELIAPLWTGTEQLVDVAAREWLLHCFPIQNESARRHLRTGLEAASAVATP